MEIGSIKQNNLGHKFKVLSRDADRSTQKHIYYFIQFLDTGYITSTRTESINDGTVKDKLIPNSLGGMVGYINTRSNRKLYNVWRKMMDRCYNPKSKSYKYYGLKGVTVCERWHRYDFFANDVVLLEGYDEYAFNNSLIELDKDIKSGEVKIYSPETCMWVSPYDNQMQRVKEYNTRNIKHVIFPDGHIEQVYNLCEFARQHGFEIWEIYDCIFDGRTQIRGYSFFRNNTIPVQLLFRPRETKI